MIKLNLIGTKADVSFNGNAVIGGMELAVNLKNGQVQPVKAELDGNTINYTFENELVHSSVKFSECGNTFFAEISVKSDLEWLSSTNPLMGEKGAVIKYESLCGQKKFLALNAKSNWWTGPNFGEKCSEIPQQTYALLGDCGKKSAVYMLLCTKTTKTEFYGNEIQFNSLSDGYTEINGMFMAFNINENPYTAIDELFDDATVCGAVTVPKVEDRKYPEMYNYFGWCSWNAFYHDVTDEGITQKLEELKKKGIPLKWLIIDDGWSQTKDWRLTSFKEDFKKFPNGLKGFIKKAKEEYGVEYVGVWHGFMAYWLGIDKTSELFIQQHDNLYETKNGMVIPDCKNESRAFSFWNEWHKYLKAQGVDFLKIDTQGSLKQAISSDMSVVEAARNMHNAVDASVDINFNGNMINCMGVTQENILNRPVSGLTRNSDDFFPNVENSFTSHLMQNAYTGLIHNQLYHCDWDMWWTVHDSCVKSSVLRAISGGPVYVSDCVGETNPEIVIPIIEDDGRILRCDKCALPARDCLFDDVSKGGKAAKLINTVGENGVMALFNLQSDKKTVSVTVKTSDIEGIDITKDYVAYSYFEKKYYYLTPDDSIDFKLGFDDVEIINFYPVEDNKIMLGDTSKYISSASKKKSKVFVDDIVF